MKNLDLIEKYLSEELNSKEQSEFDTLKKNDADFAEEVQMAVAVNADFNIKQKTRWQSLIKEQATPVLETQEAKVRTMTPRKSSFNWIRSIAAVFILGLGLSLAWMIFASPDVNTLANEELIDVYKAPTSLMSVSEEEVVDANWNNAIQAYRDGQFSVAVAAIGSSIKKNPEKLDEKNFYLGLSYLYEDAPDLDKAISHLETSKEMNDLYSAEANWFMSLAYLKKGNKENAKTLLQEVVDAATWKKAEAIALLNNL